MSPRVWVRIVALHVEAAHWRISIILLMWSHVCSVFYSPTTQHATIFPITSILFPPFDSFQYWLCHWLLIYLFALPLSRQRTVAIASLPFPSAVTGALRPFFFSVVWHCGLMTNKRASNQSFRTVKCEFMFVFECRTRDSFCHSVAENIEKVHWRRPNVFIEMKFNLIIWEPRWQCHIQSAAAHTPDDSFKWWNYMRVGSRMADRPPPN